MQETLDALGMRGILGLPAMQVARAYAVSVDGCGTGTVIDARTIDARKAA